MTKGIYIHIPFCLSKCTYCDFYSVSKDTKTMELYTNALIDEIEKSSLFHKEDKIDTLYFGGGTPSALPLYLFEKIVEALFKNFNLDLKEFTIEANPASDIAFDKYKSLGVDRVSLGVQSLNDDILSLIGRKHNSQLAVDTILKATDCFEKVSCDLMIGLPQQSVEDVVYATDFLSKKVNHISMYMLKLSDTVPMYHQLIENKFTLPDDDFTVDMYDAAYSTMKSNGFVRYEISNFAKLGYESKHNLKYWKREEYIGLGAAAHGFVNNSRYFNPSSIDDYIHGKNYGSNNVNFEFIDKDNAIFEFIMLAFRLKDGIDVNLINKMFNISFFDKYAIQLKQLKDFLDISSTHIAIKEDKLLLESAIAREFLI